VVLLHGPPGVGKTLTAETIAMATGRPLLTVSVAEIGVAYQQAEKILTEVFVDAARWEAVLLMDEAEVFVEQRSTQDVERNALVSVMLRCLEYFEGKPKSTYHHLSALLLQHTGVVIMTTNRVKAIDVAIQSRIQLAIRYHDLNRDQRLSIYKNRLKYISDDDIENREELVKSLQTSPLIRTRASDDPTNGRQIRNIVTYALALARSEGSRMNINHLTRVAETTSTFTDSMREITRKQRLKSEVEFEDQRRIWSETGRGK
jgi:SpoVK/Ycf46/Vps4 family AAA+-type ATPase